MGKVGNFIRDKKYIIIFVVLLVIALAITIAVTAAASDAQRLQYTEKADGTLEVEEIKNSYKDGWFCKKMLTVPEQVKGKKVTSVARLDSAKLQTIVLPQSVTEIKSEAFADCISLSGITLGDKITSIGKGAWRNCSSLTKIHLPEGVTEIKAQTFSGCTSLSEVTLGDKMISIGDGAFENCSSLTHIRIPQSVRSFGKNVFENAPVAFQRHEGLSYVGNDENPYFVLIGVGDEALTEAYVHENTAIAAKSCFEKNSVLKFADTASLKELPDAMFKNCEQLERVAVGAAKIGVSCFEGCVRLQRADFSENLISLENNSFAQTALTALSLPSSVAEIDVSAFAGCTRLKQIEVEQTNNTYHSAGNCLIETATMQLVLGCVSSEIPEGVTSIGTSAFQGCLGLTRITIPESIALIGTSAFGGCYKLFEVWNHSDLPIKAGETKYGSVGAYAKHVYKEGESSRQTLTSSGFLFYEDGEEVYLLGYCGDETELTLPETSPSGKPYIISAYAFADLDGLTKVVIPAAVIEIGAQAFARCVELREAYFAQTDGWTTNADEPLEDLGDPAVAADLLKDKYCANTWKQQ